MPRIPRLLAWLLCAVLCGGLLLVPSTALRAGDDRRRGARHVGRRAARRHRRSGERRADREGPHRRDRQHRPVSDRRSAAPARYVVTFTLPGFSTVKREGIELTGRGHGGGQCRAARRRDRGNRHGDRRDADRGRAERAAPGDDQRRVARRDSHRARLQRRDAAGAGHPDAGHRRRPTCRRRPAWSVFGTPGGRNGNEGRLQVDGLGVGAARNGGGVSGYNADIANAQEIIVHRVGRARRGGGVGAGAERRAEDRRQRVRRLGVPRRRQPGHGRTATTPPSCRRPGLGVPGRLLQAVGLHRRHRRSDQEGSAVVLPEPAQPGLALVGVGDVREQERRRPDEVDLSRRTPTRQSRTRRELVGSPACG